MTGGFAQGMEATTLPPAALGPAVRSVAILLGTRNGAKYLGQQLESILAQTHPAIDVWASDDASTDGTVALLNDWSARWTKGSFTVLTGPHRGFAENFRALLTNRAISSDYFAFCDQDDIWEARKLEIALSRLALREAEHPQLFCSRTMSISEEGRPIGHSPLPTRMPSFRNALVQSLAGGNTMVFNRAARDLVARASMRAPFVSHDWWSYLVVTGAGGTVYYDGEPLVRYRQHPANQIGANTTWGARIHRLRRLFAGQFYDWTDINMSGLAASRDLLTDEANDIIETFLKVREGHLGHRLRHLRCSQVHRQSIYGNLGLYLAVALRRI